MKNIRLFTAVLAALMITSAVIFNACSKQDNDLQSIDSGEVHMSTADLKFQKQLVEFRDKVKYIREHPGFKSGEVMDADSAIYHIENLFNATYSFADERYGKTITYNDSVLIDVSSEDEVLLDDMVSTFDEILATVTGVFNECTFLEKGFILLDLSKGDIINGQLEIVMRSIIGEKVGETAPFELEDGWWYGNLKGDCEWDVGYGETDAGEIIEVAINNSIPLEEPPQGYIFVYGEPENISRFGYEYASENLIFYIEDPQNNFTHNEQCLTPDEIDMYYYNEKEVIYNRIPQEENRPPNWILINCNLEGRQEDNPINYNPCIHHQNNLTYALRHMAAEAIIGPRIEL